MEHGWIDSHVHLMSDQLLIQIDDVIKRAKASNVVRIMLIALNEEEFDLALRLKDKYDILDITAGFHPEDAQSITENNYQKLEEVIKSGKISAIGEIGLDYYWDKSYVDQQKTLFRRQIELAIKYNLPISIHTRDAIQDTYDILSEYQGQVRGVMHCYSGSVEMAEAFIKLGFLISFAGTLTFKNERQNIEVAEAIPLDKILTETDGPFLTPVPFRGKTNESAYVKYTGSRLAEIKRIDNFTLQSQIIKNYKSLFK